MKTSISLAQIFIGRTAVEKLCSKPLPIRVSYNLLKIMNRYNEELKFLEEKRVDLAKSFDKENTGKVPDEKLHEFHTEWAKFINSEKVTIEYKKIDVNSLVEEVTLTPEELLSIEYLFENLDMGDIEEVEEVEATVV